MAAPACEDGDRTDELVERVRAAAARGTPLAPTGGGSKAFYGEPVEAERLEIGVHAGVIHYEPTELVLTARAGTPLTEIEALLAEHGQMLAAEPPHFAGSATLGGAVAAGLSGPRRPWAGAMRDHVLGVRLLDAQGNVGGFGGEVMKNVAGYDVARLVTGSLGTLGVLLDVSLKVLPLPSEERTVALEGTAAQLQPRVEKTLRSGTPITAAAHDGERCLIRIGGAASAVTAGRDRLGGEELTDPDFWPRLRDHALPFFREPAGTYLWRIALPAGAPPTELAGPSLTDWGGQIQWHWSDTDPARVRESVTACGGHATRIRGPAAACSAFTPLGPELWRLHQRVKSAFDPAGLFNPGRLYPGL
jgi:glycolate oxidase FAD binding subunit